MVTKDEKVNIIQTFAHDNVVKGLGSDQIIYQYDPSNGSWYRYEFNSERKPQDEPIPYQQDENDLDPYL